MSLLRGTLILSLAALISKVLGSIFRVPLQNIAGDDVLGIFSLVYPVYMVTMTLAVAGIPLAISQLIAEARAQGDDNQIKTIYQTASTLGVLFGIGSFIVIWVLSEPIAVLLGGRETEWALIVVSSALLVVPFMAVYRGFFQGFQDMTQTAVSQVIEQLIRVVVMLVAAVVLVDMGMSDARVAAGVMSGSIIGAVGSLIYLMVKFRRTQLVRFGFGGLTWGAFVYWSKRILSRSIPIAVGTVTLAAVNVVDSLTVPFSLGAFGVGDVYETYGLYGRGQALIQVATVAATSLVLPLVPRMAELLADGRDRDLRRVMARAYELIHLVAWPVMIGLVVLTVPVNVALFTNASGSDVVFWLNVSTGVTAFAVVSVGMLQGLERAKLAAGVVVVCLGLKALLNIGLVSAFGLVGAAWSTVVVFFVLMVWNHVLILRRFNGPPFWNKRNAQLLMAAVLMGVAIVILGQFVSGDDWTRGSALLYTMVMVGFGGAIYAGLCLLWGVIRLDQLPFRRN
ncbi:O-antigen/teichoic acid export membrane protein [Alkalibacillus flavidus]|uniref:O-antigen/teichoic acid export membrane protein n=1 Tax=Alkalibacillus flavidus TaxID=546021 RepID=A0ABV2KX95_9BACI